MKKKMLIPLMLVALALTGQAKGDNMPAKDDEGIFLAVVIDTSPTSSPTWRQLKILARQAIDILQPGDRLELLSAHPGKAVLHISSLIESPSVPGRKNFYKCIDGIQQTFFLFKADVAKAVEAAFDDLNKRSRSYRCCLLVLSDGKLNDNQIRQIGRLATAYSARKWPFCFTATRGANRHLFIAGSQDEMDVSLIHQVNLPQWLEKVRTAPMARPAKEAIQRPVKPTEAQPKEAKKTSNGRPTETEPAKEPVLSPGETTGMLPHIKKPNELSGVSPGVDNSRSGWYIPAYPIRGDKQPQPSVGPNDLRQPKKPKVPVKPKTKAKSMFSVLKTKWPLALATGGILAGVILLLLILPLLKPAASTSVLDQETDAGAEKPYRLMAESNGETYDLGEEKNINNLIIGKSPGSVIPITNEDVEDRQCRIFEKRGKLKIKNIGDKPILVDGLTLKKGQKEDLFLPAAIQLTKNLKIRLFRQIIEAENKIVEIQGVRP